MKRRLFTLAAAVSLLLCLAIAGLYVRAFTLRDEIHTSVFWHDCMIATFPHHVHFIVAEKPFRGPYPTSVTYGLEQYPSAPKYLRPRLSNTGVYWEISIPFWLPLLFAAPLPAYAAVQGLYRRSLNCEDRCVACGYDLRATPEQCPECGLVPERTKSER